VVRDTAPTRAPGRPKETTRSAADCTRRGQASRGASLPELAGRTITLEDLLGDARYVRDGWDLLDRGLFLELPPDGHQLFRIRGHLTPGRD